MVAEIGRVKLHSEALAAAQKRALRRLGPLMTRNGLVYFDDADRDRMPRMHWDADWNRVKKTIQRWVKEFAT